MGNRWWLWSGMMLMAVALPEAVEAQDAPTAPTAPEGASPACPAKPVALPADLLGWSAPATDRAMTKYYPRAHWLRGLNTRVSLYPIGDVGFVATPEKPVAPGTYGGMMSVSVSKPGRLRIALGERAWVDLVRGDDKAFVKTGRKGVLVPSVAHGHGPDCSGIAKIVEYDVVPGRYVIQIVNAPQAKIRAMAVAPR